MNGRGKSQWSGRGSGRGEGRTNGRNGTVTHEVPSAPARQTIGFQQPVADERVSFLFMCFVGKTVQLTTKDESIYEGIFHTGRAEGKDMNIVLRYCYTVKGPKGVAAPRSKPADTQIFYSKDVMAVDVKDVKLNAEDLAFVDTSDAAFMADSEISGERSSQKRELQAFVFDEGSSVAGVTDGGLGESVILPSNGKGWSATDMFQQNEAKFGTESTFDETLYTTKLVKGAPGGITEAEAKVLEAKIHAAKSDNPHVREERGLEDDSQMDEEDRYGAVIRPKKGAESQQSVWNTNKTAALPVATPTKPLSIEKHARKDVNEVRNYLVAGKTGSIGKSPLRDNGFMKDIKRFDALGLDPGTGSTSTKNLNAKVGKQFHEWKAAQTAKEQEPDVKSPEPPATSAKSAGTPNAASPPKPAAPKPKVPPVMKPFSFKVSAKEFVPSAIKDFVPAATSKPFVPSTPTTPSVATPIRKEQCEAGTSTPAQDDAASASGRFTGESHSASSSMREGNSFGYRSGPGKKGGDRKEGGRGGGGATCMYRGPPRYNTNSEHSTMYQMRPQVHHPAHMHQRPQHVQNMGQTQQMSQPQVQGMPHMQMHQQGMPVNQGMGGGMPNMHVAPQYQRAGAPQGMVLQSPQRSYGAPVVQTMPGQMHPGAMQSMVPATYVMQHSPGTNTMHMQPGMVYTQAPSVQQVYMPHYQER